MRSFLVLLTLSTAAIAQSGPNVPAATSTPGPCTYQIDKGSGAVMFYAGCDPSMMQGAIDSARRMRQPNAGDFDELNKRLDKIIELLSAAKQR